MEAISSLRLFPWGLRWGHGKESAASTQRLRPEARPPALLFRFLGSFKQSLVLSLSPSSFRSMTAGSAKVPIKQKQSGKAYQFFSEVIDC